MMEENIEVIDNTFNPYGIYKKVRDYFDNPEIGEFEKIQTETGTIMVNLSTKMMINMYLLLQIMCHY